MTCFVTLLLLSTLLVEGVKYTITKTGGETIRQNAKKITSVRGAKKIVIEDEFEVFEKNVLEITEKTPIFLMDQNYSLRKIKSGVFTNQEITETIVITNSQLKVVESGTFVNLKIFELVLKQNQITHLEKQAIVGLVNLEVINLANNHIVEFFADSIVSSPAVFLDLAFNRLKKLGPNWFSFMNSEKAVTILLDNNRIGEIHVLSFEDVMLDTLNLRRNKIGELPSRFFRGNLARIYMQDNSLENLPEGFFKLSHLILGVFTGNPLDCHTQTRLKRMGEETRAQIIFEHNC
ncbi:carboxypeptidase N subunit 2 [Tribolium castaneum]|uniref:carboxypeptidase N subunit 2 n=1 Tax=Tribolium castaneum TaxID=7070 RepID=UPI0030FE6E57